MRGWRSPSSRPRTIWPCWTTRAARSGWRARLARVAAGMVAERATRLTDAAQVLDLVDRALAAAQHDATVLRAVPAAGGAGEPGPHGGRHARPDQRDPAPQRDPQDDRHGPRAGRPDPPADLRQRDLPADRTVEPETINFGSVAEEKATARRVFMTMAQMLKHLDGSEPIRFLIAECDLLHDPHRALLRQAVRDRRPDRHLAAVRDQEGPGARRPDRRGRWPSRPTATTCAAAAASASRPASPTPAATWASRGVGG